MTYTPADVGRKKGYIYTYLCRDGGGGAIAYPPLSGDLFGVAVAGDGSLYVSDYGEHQVLKVSPDGKVTAFAGTGAEGYDGGGGPATAAKINEPCQCALDGAGNLYITDYGASVVRRVDTKGIITTVAGTGESGYSGDGGPATQAGHPPCSR